MSYFEPQIPQELDNQNYWPLLKKTAQQLSRIVAWTWTGCLAYTGENQIEKAKQEETLKTAFVNLLQRQVMSTNVYIYCGNPQEQTEANILAKAIQSLFLGDNTPLSEEGYGKIDVTLSDVIEKFTGEALVTTKNQEFGKMFVPRVITGSFIGGITYAPGKDEKTQNSEDKFILEFPYPPRPVLSEVTITGLQLSQWAMNLTPGDSYTPPSAYVPWAAC